MEIHTRATQINQLMSREKKIKEFNALVEQLKAAMRENSDKVVSLSNEVKRRFRAEVARA